MPRSHFSRNDWIKSDITICKWQINAKAFDEAARQGYVTVLRWLHYDYVDEELPANSENESNQFDLRWTSTALELAATNGHLAVVQWLTEHHRDVCNSFDAFNAACYMDHLEVAQFLYSKLRRSCAAEQALEHAAEGGTEDTLASLQGGCYCITK